MRVSDARCGPAVGLTLALALAPTLGCSGEPVASLPVPDAKPSPAHASSPAGSAEPPTGPDDFDGPDLLAALSMALQHGVRTADEGGSTFEVDPFVVAWVVAAVQSNGDRWLTRYQAAGADGVAVEGWQVRVVPQSPLAALGLRDGDVVERVSGVAASDVGAVSAMIARAQNRIQLTVYRDNVTISLSYTLEPMLWERTQAALAGQALSPSRAAARVVDAAHAIGQPPPHASDSGTTSSTQSRPAAPKPSGSTPSAPKPSATKPIGTPKPSGSSTPPPKPSAGSGKVKCSGSTCTVDSTYFNSMVGNPSKLVKQASIVPAISNDVHSGYKLKSVKAGTPVHELGFRSGDQVTHVNGYDLTNDAEALALYLGLGSTKKFNVRYIRGGSARTRTIIVE